MAVSEAKKKANKKWDSENLWKVTAYIPIKYKEPIKSTGKTINGFIVEAIKEKLDKERKL